MDVQAALQMRPVQAGYWSRDDTDQTWPLPDIRRRRANMADFPVTMLRPLGLEPVHPDDFFLDPLDLSPPTNLQVIGEQPPAPRAHPTRPGRPAQQAGAPGFA